MSTNFIISLVSGFLSFIIPPLLYKFSPQSSAPFNNQPKNRLFLPILISIFIICGVNYFICFDNKDFLTSFTLIEFSTPFALTGLLFFISQLNKTSKYFTFCLALASIAASFSIPADSIAAILPLPAYLNQLLIIVAWFLFSYIYRYANNGSATLGIQSAAIAFGIAILGMVNAIPFFLALIALIFGTAFTALAGIMWPPAKNNISDNVASCAGFIIFALIAWAATENAISCAITFSMLFIIDFIWAAILRLTFIEQYSNIKNNTAYQEALSAGFSAQLATSFLCRAQIIIVLLGVFQAYSNQPHSLLLFSVFITIWLLYKLRNLSLETKSLKDINKEVIADIQDRINDVKQYIDKDDNQQ
ncbi:MAG: hypothetical protein J6Y53_02675 [Alphaproteobacteria bacterium]|nr:hypothetical protein [Alphaproteobacteria bacterium]